MDLPGTREAMHRIEKHPLVTQLMKRDWKLNILTDDAHAHNNDANPLHYRLMLSAQSEFGKGAATGNVVQRAKETVHKLGNTELANAMECLDVNKNTDDVIIIENKGTSRALLYMLAVLHPMMKKLDVTFQQGIDEKTQQAMLEEMGIGGSPNVMISHDALPTPEQMRDFFTKLRQSLKVEVPLSR